MTSETNVETPRGRGLLLEGYVWTATQGEKHPTSNMFKSPPLLLQVLRTSL
jgi:hypothetical protein